MTDNNFSEVFEFFGLSLLFQNKRPHGNRRILNALIKKSYFIRSGTRAQNVKQWKVSLSAPLFLEIPERDNSLKTILSENQRNPVIFKLKARPTRRSLLGRGGPKLRNKELFLDQWAIDYRKYEQGRFN